MKLIYKLLFTFVLFSASVNAQVGIYTDTPVSTLDISAEFPSAPNSQDGVLIPRLTAFPTVDPGVEQNFMLVFRDDTAAYAGRGFYYWSNALTQWVAVAGSQWAEDVNASSDRLIYAKEARAAGHEVVVTEEFGLVGIGTDTPLSETHIQSSQTGQIEALIENETDEVELRFAPELAAGHPSWTFIAEDDGASSDGLVLLEDSTEQLQFKVGGEVRVDNLSEVNNTAIRYPAPMYSEGNGTLKTERSSSPIDDLTVDTKNFSSIELCESITPYEEVVSPAFHTFTKTPTEDILLELSYHVGADITAFGGGPAALGDVVHNSKLYGIVVRVNGVDYTYMADRMVTNNGLTGYYFMSDHLYIPLVGDVSGATTYTITMHGFVQNDVETKAGIRATFGGNPDDRIQIIEHK